MLDFSSDVEVDPPEDVQPTDDSGDSDSMDPDIMQWAHDSNIFTPPPHIAERFTRPPVTRRKSSAPSSRRNSISSTHSHHSTRSYKGSQTSYVAQQLRRASIIETRKARLADRAAHAEKVRLRAAMAKASPRASTSEERALAAQQAREKYLAQVAANCAEEVRRAKKVAEEMKAKKAAEERKAKNAMEGRLAEAERRRMEYQKTMKRGRTSSLPAIEEKKVVQKQALVYNEESAAKSIQSAWRTRQRRVVLEAFKSLKLNMGRFRTLKFEEVGALVSSGEVLEKTERMLAQIGIQDVIEDITEDKKSTRTFLSAFLILSHPSHVLSKNEEQEQDLVGKAHDLLVLFERAISALSPANRYKVSAQESTVVAEAYADFSTAFTAWKAHDSTTLAQTMIAQFVELDMIWQKVKDNHEGGVAADYAEGIRQNQTLLLVRIKRLLGPDKAIAMIREGIKEARRTRLKSKPTGDVRPRMASTSGPSSSPAESAATTESPTASNLQISHPPSTRRPSIQEDELTKVMSPLPDNRTLVHELSLNRDYRIEPPHSDIRDTINKAVFDSMRADVQAGLGHRWIVAMAENIRSRLLRLLTPGNSMYTLIAEALDPSLIENECRGGTFSYEKFFSFMTTILPRLCAPFRDDDVKALSEDTTGDLIDRLARLMHVIDLLSLDYANYLLQESAPALVKEATGYEQRRFAQDLENNVISLEKTERWWMHARVKIHAEVARRDPEGINHPASRPTAERIYFQGLTDLALAPSKLHDVDLPETLELDKARIVRMRHDALRIATIGSILLTAKNLLKRDVRSQWKSEAARMSEILKDNDLSNPGSVTSNKILSVIESSHALPSATKGQIGSSIIRVLCQASNGQLTDPVLKLLYHRLKTHVLARLSATSTVDRVRAASSASETLASLGLPEFVGQVGAMIEELSKVGEVDRQSHGSWYEEVEKKVASEEA